MFKRIVLTLLVLVGTYILNSVLEVSNNETSYSIANQATNQLNGDSISYNIVKQQDKINNLFANFDVLIILTAVLLIIIIWFKPLINYFKNI